MTIAQTAARKVYGPTWTRGPDGLFALPDLTLGWAVIDWCQDYLLQPDGPDAGEPWRFTKEQTRFVLWWYAIDPRGRFIYRTGMLRRMKGWGKDPISAAICSVEAVGPCRFDGLDKDGNPKAVAPYAACVQIAAVSQDQVKRNTMSLFPLMFSSKAIADYKLDIGKEIIWANDGRCRIEMLTTSARSAEGPRPTFILKNETQHWIPSNGGDAMAAVCDRNAAKSRDGATRVLAISNAHAPDEGSDAEVDYEAYMLNPRGVLYDSIEASEAVVDALTELKKSGVDARRAEELREFLTQELIWCRGDSDWLDVERLMEECEAPRTSLNMALRFYFNRLAASEDKPFDKTQWDLLAAPRSVLPGELITLGFDGSTTRDHTALIGTEVATGYQWVVGYWEPQMADTGEIKVPEDQVDATVKAAFDRWNVWRMNADPFYWREWLSTWAGRYDQPGHPVVAAWDTTADKKMSVALLDYRNAIQGGELTHDGDERFSAGFGNAYKRTEPYRDDKGEFMWTIRKERPDSPLKIDAVMAGCLSWRARLDAIAAGALNDTDEYAGATWL